MGNGSYLLIISSSISNLLIWQLNKSAEFWLPQPIFLIQSPKRMWDAYVRDAFRTASSKSSYPWTRLGGQRRVSSIYSVCSSLGLAAPSCSGHEGGVPSASKPGSLTYTVPYITISFLSKHINEKINKSKSSLFVCG